MAHGSEPHATVANSANGARVGAPCYGGELSKWRTGRSPMLRWLTQQMAHGSEPHARRGATDIVD
jgi:hypothetical protein